MEHGKQSTMTDSAIVDSLVNEFTCIICLDLIDEPRSACRWGHTFCREVGDRVFFEFEC